jgi:hypothetical protein
LLAHHYGITHLLDIPCFCLLQSDWSCVFLYFGCK